MMMEKKANPSIACSVCDCTHHAKTENHCTLHEIKVDCCCGAQATNCASTECASFCARK